MPFTARLFVASLACSPFCVLNAQAQRDPVQHERSGAPSEARFELVQSTLAARSTYRIDKVTGRTDQIVMRPDSTLTWQPIRRLDHPAGDLRVPGRPNYQLFVSGLANRHTYLINTNNGATWQLVSTSDDTLAWQPVNSRRGGSVPHRRARPDASRPSRNRR